MGAQAGFAFFFAVSRALGLNEQHLFFCLASTSLVVTVIVKIPSKL